MTNGERDVVYRPVKVCHVVRKEGKHPVTNNDVVLFNCSECDSWIGKVAKFCSNCGAEVVDYTEVADA